MTVLKVSVSGQEARIEVTRQGSRMRIVRNEQVTDLRLVHVDGPFLVLELERSNGTRRLIRAAGHSAPSSRSGQTERQMWVDGQTFTYSPVRPSATGATNPNTGSLSASIPAVVAEVLVSVGQIVNAGDKLVLLESMKMIIPIQAPYGGRVSNIHCAVGEPVQAGVPLIEIEEIGD